MNPSLEEVSKFQQHANNLFGFESDQDEWDTLNDATLQKTIIPDRQVKLDVGDRVLLVDGQYKNLKGTILAALPDE